MIVQITKSSVEPSVRKAWVPRLLLAVAILGMVVSCVGAYLFVNGSLSLINGNAWYHIDVCAERFADTTPVGAPAPGILAPGAKPGYVPGINPDAPRVAQAPKPNDAAHIDDPDGPSAPAPKDPNPGAYPHLEGVPPAVVTTPASGPSYRCYVPQSWYHAWMWAYGALIMLLGIAIVVVAENMRNRLGRSDLAD